jgi:hypothetical protein
MSSLTGILKELLKTNVSITEFMEKMAITKYFPKGCIDLSPISYPGVNMATWPQNKTFRSSTPCFSLYSVFWGHACKIKPLKDVDNKTTARTCVLHVTSVSRKTLGQCALLSPHTSSGYRGDCCFKFLNQMFFSLLYHLVLVDILFFLLERVLSFLYLRAQVDLIRPVPFKKEVS